MILKRAAMFGLDARIALAIFAALSVIVGASLATIIKNVKATQYINEIKELEKSIEAFYLDTGTYPDYDADIGSIVHVRELVSNDRSLIGWRGPYTSLKINPPHTIFSKIDSGKGFIAVRLGSFDPFSNTIRKVCTIININEKDCVMWAEWYNVNKEIFELINKKIDDDGDSLNGRVRYCPSCGDGSLIFRLDII